MVEKQKYFSQDSCGQVLNVRWVPNNDTMVCVEFADTTGVDWAVKHLEVSYLSYRLNSFRKNLLPVLGFSRGCPSLYYIL